VLALAVIFGASVGFALGLTGGGGSIIAVPLLVYGLAVSPRQAIGVSLAAVGSTALVGAVDRLRRREVEVRTGVMFAVAGMIGAPLGAFLGRQLPETLLLTMFAALMIWVALMMWRKASKRPEEAAVVRAPGARRVADDTGVACRRDPTGRLTMTSRCATVMSIAGVVTGVLSGLFGVGGGFVIVPALVMFSGMSIHRAVATSLMVIALVSASGVVSYLLADQPLAAGVTTLFVLGGIVGLGVGTLVARRLSPVKLQKVFAAAIVAVATFVIVKNVA
jgi:uncharacterized membrane protein YfcA